METLQVEASVGGYTRRAIGSAVPAGELCTKSITHDDLWPSLTCHEHEHEFPWSFAGHVQPVVVFRHVQSGYAAYQEYFTLEGIWLQHQTKITNLAY